MALTLLVLGALANGALLAIPDPAWATVASLTLTILVPGGLLALLLIPAQDTDPVEWIAVALGLGLTALIVSGLVLHYAPLPLRRWVLLAWFDGLALTLAATTLLMTDNGDRPPFMVSRPSFALPLVLLLGAALRLPNLGYSEFQGDEAKVILPASAVLQDVGDALFYHGKGPAEILVVAVQYGLVGALSEASARLPFALASVVGLGVVYLLARRLLGDAGALVTALLLACNGYLVAFARIAQYQSLVFLLSALAVWCAVRYMTRDSHVWPVLAGAFVASGTLAHYDAIFALPPIAVLALGRGRSGRLLERQTLLGWLAGAAVGLALLLLFFGPYSLSPLQHLAADRITERVGADFPHNNLPRIGASAALYTSLPYLVLITSIAALSAPLVMLSARSVMLHGAWRVGLVWFGVPLFFYAFVARHPGTHAHVTSTGLALLGGGTIAALWQTLRGRRWRPAVIGAVGALLALVGAYLAPVYLQTHRELVRGNLEDFALARFAGDQTAVAERFGFPYAAGWKVVGQLFAEGRLAGSFDSNEKPQITHWYTRGAWRCAEQPRYYLVAENVQDEIEPPRRRVMADYPLVGVVTVGGRPKLRVHEHGAGPVEPEIWPLEAFATGFDRDLSGAAIDPGVWARGPVAIEHTPAPARFGDAVDLLGYRLLAEDPRPGGTVRLDLFWTPLISGGNYAVHVRLGADEPLGDDGGRDCDRTRLAQRWSAGQPFVQGASLSIAADAPPGRHPILVGVSRLAARGPRLPPTTELPTRDRLVEIGRIDVEARR